MNFTAKPSALKILGGHGTLIPAAAHHHHSPIFSTPISSLSFRRTPRKSLSLSFPPIKASSHFSSNNNPPPEFPFSFLKTSVIATTVAAFALFFSRFHFLSCKPAFASSSSSATVETTNTNDAASDREREKTLEKHLLSHPNDVEALQNLMEIRIKNKKPEESISIVEKLIELEPEEPEWPLMKAHLHAYVGDSDLAKTGFNDIISKDPLRVEAYHGLVVAASQDDVSIIELRGIEKRIEEAMKLCEKESKQSTLTDFKLLLAQIYVMEGKYAEAIIVYKQLAKEDPSDFRPYLCQGIIFTLLRNKEDADRNFEKYRGLVPRGHPYARYFEDNMIATKFVAQKVENERAKSKR